MGIGVSVFLIATGAILAFAVNLTTAGIDLNMVGVILMIVGLLGLILSFTLWSEYLPWRRRTVVYDRDYVEPPADRYVVERRERRTY